MKKMFVMLSLVLGFASVSQAGILIEPYLGYASGTTEYASGKLTGTQAGLRLAYAAPLLFWGGLDYTTAVSESYSPDSSTYGDSGLSSHSTAYAVLGVNLPILLRGWVGYGFSDSLKFDSTRYTYTDYDGTAVKVGVGFTGLPFVSLNLEYIMETFTKGNNNTLTNNFTNKAIVASVSLPFKF